MCRYSSRVGFSRGAPEGAEDATFRSSHVGSSRRAPNSIGGASPAYDVLSRVGCSRLGCLLVVLEGADVVARADHWVPVLVLVAHEGAARPLGRVLHVVRVELAAGLSAPAVALLPPQAHGLGGVPLRLLALLVEVGGCRLLVRSLAFCALAGEIDPRARQHRSLVGLLLGVAGGVRLVHAEAARLDFCDGSVLGAHLCLVWHEIVGGDEFERFPEVGVQHRADAGHLDVCCELGQRNARAWGGRLVEVDFAVVVRLGGTTR